MLAIIITTDKPPTKFKVIQFRWQNRRSTDKQNSPSTMAVSGFFVLTSTGKDFTNF